MKKLPHQILALTLSSLLINAYTAPAFAAHQTIDASATVTGQKYENMSDADRAGALFVTDANTTPGQRGSAEVTLNDVTFTGNEVTGNGYGGAVFLQDGTLTVQNGNFSDNKASWDGGAISTRSPYLNPSQYPDLPNGLNSNPQGAGKLVIHNSVFENNTAAEYSGGAIGLYTEAEISNTRFTGNNAGGHVPTDKTDGGGAIYMGGWAQATLKGNTFENNSSNRGGAIGTSDAGIASAAYFHITDTAFTGNTATKEGGAVFNKFATANNVIADSTFTGNTAGLFGGAIYNKGTLTAGGVFAANEAQTGGGAVYNEGTLEISDGSKFSGNISKANDGGAIYSGNYAGNKPQDPAVFAPVTTVIGKNVIFENNQAQSASGATVSGGAVTNLAKSTMSVGENALFVGNSAPTQGGAVSNSLYNVTKYDAAYRPQLTVADGAVFRDNTAMVGGAAANESGVMIFKNNALFENNAALTGTNAGRGGALANRSYDDLTSEVTLADNSVFRANTSANNGGAVYNYSDTSLDKAVISFGNGVLFENNTAADKGGAVYNEGIINFNGDSAFTGNIANSTANDIYNLGTLNFNSGTAKLEGGITGTGDVNVASGAVLDIGLSDVYGSALRFADGSTLAVTLARNAMGSLQSNDISVGQTSSDGAKLLVTLSKDFLTDEAGISKQLASSAVKNGSFALADAKNALYNVSFDNTTNTVTAQRKSQQEQNEIIKQSGGTDNNMHVINAFTSASDLGSDAANQTADLINSLAQTDTVAAVNATTALAPETASSRQTVQSAVTQQVFAAVNARMADASASGPSSFALGEEDLSYANDVQNYSVWAQGLINKSHKEAASGASAFTGRSTGLAGGADLKLGDEWLAGLGYAYTHTNVDSFNRHSRILGDNFFAYAQYRPGDFFVQGAFNYGDSKYEEEKYLPGMQVNADYHVKTYAANLTAGYDVNDWFTPLAGVRYMNLQQEGYKDSSDQSVSAAKSDYFTGVLGVQAAAPYRTAYGLRLKPQVNAGVAYDFLSDNAAGSVLLPNGASYDVNGERLHRLSFEAGVSLSALISDSTEILLSYDGSFRRDYNSNTGTLKLRYMF